MPTWIIRASLRKPYGFSLNFCIDFSTWLEELSQVQKDVLEIVQPLLCPPRKKSKSILSLISTLVSKLRLKWISPWHEKCFCKCWGFLMTPINVQVKIFWGEATLPLLPNEKYNPKSAPGSGETKLLLIIDGATQTDRTFLSHGEQSKNAFNVITCLDCRL